ncbi:MAG TPA: DoxX family protein [Puia sp.]|jgi:cytochrome bd-type quinol oxidase subunit 2|nr:DoxX family protein [Puia sp.]
MQTTTITNTSTATSSRARLWTGRILTYLLLLFLLFDAIMKVIKERHTIETSAKLGWQPDAIQTLGFVLLVSTILYAIPRTAALGAILLTAYLGGAVAASIMSHYPFIFPIIFDVIVWLALWLRDEKLSSHLPVRKN